MGPRGDSGSLPTRRVLVASWDRVGARMAGSAIRALEMAAALGASGFDVTLAVPEGSEVPDRPGVGAALVPPGGSLHRLIAQADVVVLPGRTELMTAVDRPLVVDLYDPFVLSNLDLYGDDFDRSGGAPLLALRWLQHHLENGDFFLCASESQRAFWLGMLAAAGRVNRATYRDDPELRRLLAVVPFGVPVEGPAPGSPVVKSVIAGIDVTDRLVVWAGGMWNWLDPLTLIRAMARLRDARPDVKALLLGMRHPNPEIGEMEMARQARELATSLGLAGRSVFFLDWVPYEERHLYLLEADVAVSLHRSGVESEFAFRTRVLDYLWCGRPMVLTRGDDLASRVEREDLGRVVAPEDVAGVARAIDEILQEGVSAGCAERLAHARHDLQWARVVEPLRAYCRDPRRAPDLVASPWFAPGQPRSRVPRKEDACISQEFLPDARLLSRPIGPDAEIHDEFVAAYDGLCEVSVLVWYDAPAPDVELVFELRDCGSGGSAAGTAPGSFVAASSPGGTESTGLVDTEAPAVARDAVGRLVARITVPAAQLPHNDWQRFGFRPVPASRGRRFEFRLACVLGRSGEPVASFRSGGRICVWHRADETSSSARAGICFIARHLVKGILDELPVEPESFLFLHNTTLPADGDAASHAPTGGAPTDVDGLRVELARAAAEAGAARHEVHELRRQLDDRMAAAAEAARSAAVAGVEEIRILRLLARHARASVGRAVRRAKRWVGVFLTAGLTAATVPVALSLAALYGAVDLVARIARRRGRAGVDGTSRVDGSAVAGHAGDGSSGKAAPSSRPGSDAAISVVIPTWNGRELLEMSLPPLVEALRVHGRRGHEILVVDNGSEDDTVAWLHAREAQWPEVRVVSLARNEGFAGATNRGAREAVHPVLVLLNNDMVVEPDFVAPLLEAFDAAPDAFGISCQIDFIDPAKPRWETGKVHGALERGSVRLFHLDDFDDTTLWPIFFAGGGASAYDRAKFLELGGFDEAVFSPVYIEDVDLGYRAWRRGWPALLAPRSRVHHKHRGTTRRRWSEATIHSFFVKNLAALVQKNVSSWAILSRHLAGLTLLPRRVWREKGAVTALRCVVGLVRQAPRVAAARWREARLPRALRDEEIFSITRHRFAYEAWRRASGHAPARSDKPQILLISPFSPVPPVHGGATRMRNLLREIRDVVDVTLLSFVDTEAECRPESLAELGALCREVCLVPRTGASSFGKLDPERFRGFFSWTLIELVGTWLDRRAFDVVQVEYTQMAPYLPPPTPGLLRVLVEHDVCFVAARRDRRAAGRFRFASWLDGLRMLRFELRAVEAADLVFAMSDTDRAQLARFVDPDPIEVVPNGVSCRDFPFGDDAEREAATILFVGFFRHRPNAEAVHWFVREVLPRVRERVPAARFRVVGAYPTDDIRALATTDPGIEVTGMVPDVAPHYRRATVFVAPILQGSGTRLKILEAMASGCPVVSTTVGAEGLGAGAGELRIADDAAALARTLVDLLGDAVARRDLAANARTFVEERYDWPAIARRMLEAYARRSPRVAAALAADGGQQRLVAEARRAVNA